MNKQILVLSAILLQSFWLSAQVFDSTKTANVEISLTNKLTQPLQQEEVLLVSENKKAIYKVITNSTGEAFTTVKAGYNYTIILKTLADSFTYGTLNIPAITAKQVYTTPFKLEMIFEPAKSYTFHNLEFDVNKSTIKKQSFSELEMLVDYLKRKSNVKLQINGHTDSDGNEKANLFLSKQRAEAVKLYLVKNGIDAKRLSCEGFGASQPVADNNTPEGKQKNRRTEIEFLMN